MKEVYEQIALETLYTNGRALNAIKTHHHTSPQAQAAWKHLRGAFLNSVGGDRGAFETNDLEVGLELAMNKVL